MINLIPKEEKKKIKRGLYYKLLVLFILVVAVSVLIFFVAIIPSYFLSSAKNNIANDKLEVQKNEPVPLLDQETQKVIKDLNTKLDIIKNAQINKFTISEKVINAIILRKIPGIKITDISYDSISQGDPLQGQKISIQGTAPSREILLLFRKSLEENTIFQSVDLPISNFVKGSNIQFYLSLIPRSDKAPEAQIPQ